MFKRCEFKYLVSNSEAEALRKEILPFVILDKYAKATGRGEYAVRSIYYDTVNFDSYYEKIEGLAFRKKFRIRGYNEQKENSRVFVEIKNKRESFVDKDRASLPFGCLEEFLNCGSMENFGNSELFNGGRKDAEKFMFHLVTKNLHPTCLIVYDREAFQGKFDSSLRVTFDKNLRCMIFPLVGDLYCEQGLSSAMRNDFILEFKFSGGVPLWFKYITEKFNLTRRALSKYTICLDNQILHKTMRFCARNKFAPIGGTFLYKRNLI